MFGVEMFLFSQSKITHTWKPTHPKRRRIHAKVDFTRKIHENFQQKTSDPSNHHLIPHTNIRMYCTCPNIIDSQQYYGPLQNLEMRIHRNIFMELSPLWIFPLRILEFVVRKFHQRPSETGCVCLVNVDIFLVKQLTGVNETWKDAF